MSANTTSSTPLTPTPTTTTSPSSSSPDPTTTPTPTSPSSTTTTTTTTPPVTTPSSTTTTTPSSTTTSSSTTTTAPPSTSTPPPTTSTSDHSSTRTTSTVTVHNTSTAPESSTTSSLSSSSSSSSAVPQGTSKPVSHGLSQQGTIAVAVVVPIVAVALILVALLFLWRRRKARKDAEELRRKEVEEYGYNPNNDPTLPAVGGARDGAYEMREDGSAGYRGWGTTAVASSGRKASTTQSGGPIGMAYSDSSPSRGGPVSDTRSDNHLMGEGEVLGAMGPAAAANRGDIHRGPSNASSSYSAANRSDGSGELGQSGAAYYSNQYESGNPYGDAQYGSNNAQGGGRGAAEMGGQPVIRDVEARRNTRIENPAHFPQQSAGISQNF